MEYFDLVDDEGLPTGEIASREEAHRLGLPHRTTHTWVLRSENGVWQALLLAFGYSLISIFVNRAFSRYILLLFVQKTETQVLSLGMQYLTVCSRFYSILVVIYVLRNALQGMGFSIPAMTAGVFELVARGVMGYVFVRMYGYSAVCLANPVAWAAADLLLVPMSIVVLRRFRTDPAYLKKRTQKSYA